MVRSCCCAAALKQFDIAASGVGRQHLGVARDVGEHGLCPRMPGVQLGQRAGRRSTGSPHASQPAGSGGGLPAKSAARRRRRWTPGRGNAGTRSAAAPPACSAIALSVVAARLMLWCSSTAASTMRRRVSSCCSAHRLSSYVRFTELGERICSSKAGRTSS